MKTLSALEQLKDLRVAIVHYWFVGRAGGEHVVEALAELFPTADLFCLVADQRTLNPELQKMPLKTSFLQNLPGARRFHRHFLFLQPLALEQFDFTDYDLVISSESGPAKGVITSTKTCHICYCHSPMRYIWEMYPRYKASMNPLVAVFFSLVAHYLRIWDYASSKRVDYFIANSRFIASRIKKYYGAESTVIYPPVDSAKGSPNTAGGDFYLTVGRLVGYKRFDLAVSACTELGRPLRVIGDGPELAGLRRIAGPNVEFLGRVSDEDLRANLAGCRAMLFPGEEDFGIAPVEAQSFGKPVIAYASGGALETVRGSLTTEEFIENPTGIFFHEQTSSSLVNAILEFEHTEIVFSPELIHNHSLQFDRSVFKKSISEFVASAWKDFSTQVQR